MDTRCPDCGSKMHSGWCLNEDCPSYQAATVSSSLRPTSG